jgi:TonB-linked SusC/RagA family outer membrane protein
MKYKLYTLFTAICLLLTGSGAAFAQNLTVSGKVVDSKGEPLEGAAVIVKGTATGTLVGPDGGYTLKVKKNSVLEASMMGYVTETQEVNGRTVVNFTLKDDAVMLQEAVIEVGYGEQRLVDVTGTVAHVKIDEIRRAPVAGLDQALQGRIAGVAVTSADGQPGYDMDVVIRGANSLTQSNAPLYVIDGFPMEDYSTSALSPNDIASVTVLKDASSTAIYGSRGANGVIIIETKKGKLGKTDVSYSGTVGIHQAAKQMELMTPYEFVLYQLERGSENFDKYLTNPGRTLEDYINYNAIDWQDRVFRNALVQTHHLSVMGGTEQTRFSVSGSVVDQPGVIVNSGYQKYQGRFALEHKLSKTLRLNLNASYTEAITSGQASSASLSTSNSYTTYLMYRVWTYRPVSLTTLDEEDLLADENDSAATMNPVISNANEQTSRRNTTFNANGKLEWKITPTLKLNLRAGFENKLNRWLEFNNSKTYKGFPRVTNTLGINGIFRETQTLNWMNENTVSWNPKLSRKHKLSVLGGFTMQGTDKNIYGFTAAQIPHEDLGLSGMDDGIPQEMVTTLSKNTLMSFLGRVNYSYGDRYLFTGSLRADGSSKFAPGHKWGLFPSAAFAWRFSREDFMKNVTWVEDAKLRLTYGSTGNNKVGDYSSYATLSATDYYPFDNTPQIALVQSALGNEDLTWETTDQVDLGLDLRLFDGRLSLTADLYRKITRNLLLNARLPYSTGFASMYKNIGKIRNDGLELTLGFTPIHTRDFIWSGDFNISFNRDRVLQLSEGQEVLLNAVSFTGDFNATNLYIARVGGPVASFYGAIWEGVYGVEDFDVTPAGKYVLKEGVPSNGNDRASIQPGDIKYADINGDGIVNDQDMVVIGRCAPIHIGGLNNNFTWRNFNLNIFFQWSYGNDIMNANRIFMEGNYGNKNINQFASYNDHWTFDNQNSRNFRVGGQGPRGIYSSRTIEDGGFLRLKTMQLSYTLPRRITNRMHLESLSVNISGQNLWTLTRYSGLDPEVSTRHTTLTPGFDYSAYARNRVFTTGIDITF